MTTDHQVQLEQQITTAWQRYITATLDGRADEARLTMKHINRLLDRLPRQRDPID